MGSPGVSYKSKGTKKLDKALLLAILSAQAVTRDARDERSGEAYVSAEAVFEEGRAALADQGLILWPLGWEQTKFCGRECLVRVVEVLHVESGQYRRVRSTPYPLDHSQSPTLGVGGIATLSLCYLVRDLLMLPRAHPETAEGVSVGSGTVQTFGKTFTEADQVYLDALLDDAEPAVAEVALADIEKGRPKAEVLAELRHVVPPRKSQPNRTRGAGASDDSLQIQSRRGDQDALRGHVQGQPGLQRQGGVREQSVLGRDPERLTGVHLRQQGQPGPAQAGAGVLPGPDADRGRERARARVEDSAPVAEDGAVSPFPAPPAPAAVGDPELEELASFEFPVGKTTDEAGSGEGGPESDDPTPGELPAPAPRGREVISGDLTALSFGDAGF